MKVTAETITDEQIRMLRSTTEWEGTDTNDAYADFALALSRPRDPQSPLSYARGLARARCAAAWNARRGGAP